MRDFGFFLDHGNFFKVVDTLEKFEVNMVNKESQAGRDFVVFKRQLYQMYEVRHRSVWEHEQFSLNVERRNLKWLHEANRDFITELQRVNYLDQLADTGSLGGKVFKKKFMNADKIRGLSMLGLSVFGWMKLPVLTMMMGSSLPMAAITMGAMYGMNQFAEKQVISSIESLPDGMLSITYMKSPVITATITAHVKDVYAVCAVGQDDMGADDVESNVIAIEKFMQDNEHHTSPICLTLPADAFRDKQMMEWIMAKKDAKEETTVDDFTDMLREKFEMRCQKGGLGMLTAFHVRETGLAQFAKEKEIEQQMLNDGSETEDSIRRLQELYG